MLIASLVFAGFGPTMFSHFGNLLLRATKLLVGWLSTSLLSILVFTVGVPTSVFVLSVLYRWYRGGRTVSLKRLFKESAASVAIGVGVCVLAWVFLFGWAVVRTIYTDHQSLVSASGALKSRTATLQAQLEKAKSPNPHRATPDQREERKKIRNGITKLLQEGVALQHSCLVNKEQMELGTQANEWSDKTYKYLNSVDSSYGARFSAASGLPNLNIVVPQPNNNVWNYLNAKNQVLGQILAELHD
jgi:hypothetical protein